MITIATASFLAVQRISRIKHPALTHTPEYSERSSRSLGRCYPRAFLHLAQEMIYIFYRHEKWHINCTDVPSNGLYILRPLPPAKCGGYTKPFIIND